MKKYYLFSLMFLCLFLGCEDASLSDLSYKDCNWLVLNKNDCVEKGLFRIDIGYSFENPPQDLTSSVLCGDTLDIAAWKASSYIHYYIDSLVEESDGQGSVYYWDLNELGITNVEYDD